MDYNMEINIGKLILEGFPSHYRNRISNSIQHELIKIFRQEGIPESLMRNRDIDRINMKEMKVSSSHKPEMIGNQIAQTIYSALGNG